MNRAIKENNLAVLRRVIYELGNVGMIFPGSALVTLQYASAITNEQGRKTLLESLAKIRAVHPDITEKFLKDNAPALLDEVKGSEVDISLEAYGGVNLFLRILFEVEDVKNSFIDILSKISEYKDENEFIRYSIGRIFDLIIHHAPPSGAEK